MFIITYCYRDKNKFLPSNAISIDVLPDPLGNGQLIRWSSLIRGESMAHVGPTMRLMQLDLKMSSPSTRSLNNRPEGVSEPSSGSWDHENDELLNPRISLVGGEASAIGTLVWLSSYESRSSVCCRNSWTRSKETFPAASYTYIWETVRNCER
jgi:hypothetical protein